MRKISVWLMAAILFICGTTELMFTGCRNGDVKSSWPEATDMITAASGAKDYERVLSLADSLEKARKISPGESNYWQGYAHYQMGRRDQAKASWQEAIRVTENSTDANDLVYFAKSASYLTSQLCRYAEYAAALYTALLVINRLEIIQCDTTIFLFTDGLTEAMNTENEEFQMNSINAVAVDALSQQQQEPRLLIDLMTEAVHQFVGDAEQSDDLTMMGIQYIKQI